MTSLYIFHLSNLSCLKSSFYIQLIVTTHSLIFVTGGLLILYMSQQIVYICYNKLFNLLLEITQTYIAKAVCVNIAFMVGQISKSIINTNYYIYGGIT